MNTKLILFILILSTIAFSCKKDKTTKTSISGTVINKATHKPVIGIKVGLSSTKDTQGGLIPFGPTMWGKFDNATLLTTTDENGNFYFENIEIHSHQAYRYQLFTASGLSLNNGHTEFGDVTLEVDKNNPGKNHELEVCPDMDYLWIQLNPSTTINHNDSASVILRHKYDHLRGSMPLSYTLTSSSLKQGYKCYALQHEIMGQWYLTIYKLKNNSASITKDSVLLNYGDTMTYILNF